MTSPWNPRYVAYAYPRDPADQLEVDRKRYPDGFMPGYLFWIGERWAEYRHHRHISGPAALEDAAAGVQTNFDAWLKEWAGVTDWPAWAPRDNSRAV